MMAGRDKDANAVAEAWMQAAARPEKLPPVDLEKLQSAISFAVGERFQQYQSWMDPRWRKPLLTVTRHLLEHRNHLDVASRIIGHYRYSSKDEARPRS